MKKQILLFLAGLLCPLAGMAHPVEPSTVKEGNIITGHVIEKGTEENLAYATVLIVENGMGTVTGDDGHFRLKDVPAGKYTHEGAAHGLCLADQDRCGEQRIYR